MLNREIEDRKLSKLINYAEMFPINDIPGFTRIVSLDLKYIKVSANVLQYFNQMEENLFDQSDIGCKDPIELMNEIKMLSYNQLGAEWKTLLGHKKLIICDNEIIGTIANFIDITNNGLIDVGRLLFNKEKKLQRKKMTFLIQNRHDYHGLTKKEQECLFFLIRGCSYAEISKRLHIAITTIQTHIEHIKHKLQVGNKSQVIEKALALGFLSVIPETLLTK